MVNPYKNPKLRSGSTVKDAAGKFAKGHKGPGHPLKGDSIAEWVREYLTWDIGKIKTVDLNTAGLTAVQTVALRLIRDAINGKHSAMKLMMSYVDGVPQLSGGSPVGAAANVSIVFPKEFEGL